MQVRFLSRAPHFAPPVMTPLWSSSPAGPTQPLTALPGSFKGKIPDFDSGDDCLIQSPGTKFYSSFYRSRDWPRASGICLPSRTRGLNSRIPLQVRGTSDNGSTNGLQPFSRGSTPRFSTKCGRSRVAQAAGCEPVHESSILSGHPFE